MGVKKCVWGGVNEGDNKYLYFFTWTRDAYGCGESGERCSPAVL